MKKTTVVVVDDSALIRKLLTEIINNQSDMEVIGTAADPLAAREMIREMNPDVLTLDVEMPKMDGLAVCKELREKVGYLPILMLTAKDDIVDKVLGLEMGADDYIVKPFTGDELLDKLSKLLA